MNLRNSILTKGINQALKLELIDQRNDLGMRNPSLAIEFDKMKQVFSNFKHNRNFKIEKAFLISNKSSQSAFEKKFDEMFQNCKKNPVEWENDEENGPKRDKVLKRFQKFSEKFQHNSNSLVKLIPVLHTVSDEKLAWSIACSGFSTTIGKTNFTNNVPLAVSGCFEKGNEVAVVVVSWLIMSSVYPILENEEMKVIETENMNEKKKTNKKK